MDQQYRSRLEAVLTYDEDTAGGLMDTSVITVRADVTLEVVLRYLRRHESIPSHTDVLMVVDRFEHYRGVLPITALLLHDPDTLVGEVMESDRPPIPAEMPDGAVAAVFEDRDLVSAAVVDENNLLLGRITVDDVVDVIRDEGVETLHSYVGLSEDEDLFDSVLSASRRRAVWLGVNLITAFIAAAAIGLFQDTLERVVALAVLMPIVASMGGIAGSQTLILVIRGMALGQVSSQNVRALLLKELGRRAGQQPGLVRRGRIGRRSVVRYLDDRRSHRAGADRQHGVRGADRRAAATDPAAPEHRSRRWLAVCS